MNKKVLASALAGLMCLLMLAITYSAVLDGQPVAYYLKALNSNIVGEPATVAQPAAQQGSAPATSVLPQQPLLTAACIDKILEKSPAKRTGAYFVQYGQDYGVDPAFALAVFRQEDSLCSSDVDGSANFTGCINKSIGNIQCTTGTCYKNFNAYPSWEEGIKAFYSQLKNGSYYIKAGNTTVETIYPKWANAGIASQNVQNVKDFLAQYRAQAKTC
jgi:hypothetical protein